jgi:hypothetical protein
LRAIRRCSSSSLLCDRMRMCSGAPSPSCTVKPTSQPEVGLTHALIGEPSWQVTSRMAMPYMPGGYVATAPPSTSWRWSGGGRKRVGVSICVRMPRSRPSGSMLAPGVFSERRVRGCLWVQDGEEGGNGREEDENENEDEDEDEEELYGNISPQSWPSS